MAKLTIRLDKAEITEKIIRGDQPNGRYILAVAPDGSAHGTHWAQDTRQWHPWPDGWLTIDIPALDPDGSGRESDDARDMLRELMGRDAFQVLHEERHLGEEKSWPELAEELYPEDWRYNRDEGANWLAEAFLDACNGQGDDLGVEAPWGELRDEDGRILGDAQPPAHFCWTHDPMALVDAAKVYKMPYTTLAHAARQGRIKARRSGATYWISPGAIEEAIRTGKLRPRKA